MDMLIINNLWKKENKHFLLKDISLAIQQNEWLLITGPTGEGKEALLNILLRFDERWVGEIYFAGYNIKDYKNYFQEIAFINKYYQQLETSESVYDFLSFPLKLNGRKENKLIEKINNLLIDQTLFKNKLTDLIGDLTIEDKFVICFIKAILTKPKLIIIEEPFYELTNNIRMKVILKLKALKDTFNDCSVIIFSSYAEEWFDVCDRIAILHNSSIVQLGKKDEIIEKPQTIFAVSYINREQFYFLRGEIINKCFRTRGFKLSLPNFIIDQFRLFHRQKVYLALNSSDFQVYVDHLHNSFFEILLPVHFIQKHKEEWKIYSNIGGQPVMAKIKNDLNVIEQSEILLKYHFKNLYFYDYATKTLLK